MSDPEEGSDLVDIFGGNAENAARIPEDLRPVLLERWTKLRRELNLDSPKPNVSDKTEKTSDEPAPDLSKFLIQYHFEFS